MPNGHSAIGLVKRNVTQNSTRYYGSGIILGIISEDIISGQGIMMYGIVTSASFPFDYVFSMGGYSNTTSGTLYAAIVF